MTRRGERPGRDPEGIPLLVSGVQAANIAARRTVITRVDKQPVESVQALRDKLTTSALNKGVLLQVQSPQGGTDFLVLKATANANP